MTEPRGPAGGGSDEADDAAVPVPVPDDTSVPVPVPDDTAEPVSDLRPTTAVSVSRVPRVPTRALVALVLVLAVALVVGVVVSLVLLHQPRLVPVPVPSVSQI